MNWQAALFIFLSLPITIFSWPFFRLRKRYGFYRFFSFESALGLVVLNLPFWFTDPFNIPQVFSWPLLIASILLVAAAVVELRRVGKPQGRFEATTCLVKTGVYRYVRHPMYASLLTLGWGAGLKHLSWLVMGLLIILTVSAALTARVEEAEDLTKFGAAYEEYKRETRWFIPFLV